MKIFFKNNQHADEIELELDEQSTIQQLRQQQEIPDNLIAVDGDDYVLREDYVIQDDDHITFREPQVDCCFTMKYGENEVEVEDIIEGTSILNIIEGKRQELEIPEDTQLTIKVDGEDAGADYIVLGVECEVVLEILSPEQEPVTEEEQVPEKDIDDPEPGTY